MLSLHPGSGLEKPIKFNPMSLPKDMPEFLVRAHVKNEQIKAKKRERGW